MAKKRHAAKASARSEFEPSPEAYWRAATRRLETATFLLENSRHYTDTIYLGGYAVECVLKCLIFERTVKEKYQALGEDIGSGSLSHNFDYLVHRLKSIGVVIPADVGKSLLILAGQWSTDLRYSGALISRSRARSFIEHVVAVVEWVKRSR